MLAFSLEPSKGDKFLKTYQLLEIMVQVTMVTSYSLRASANIAMHYKYQFDNVMPTPVSVGFLGSY